MKDEQKELNDEKLDAKPRWLRFVNGLGLVAAIGIASTTLSIYKSKHDLDRYKVEREQQVADEIAAEAVSLLEAKRTAEQAEKGAEFAECWPDGNCPGIPPVLPVDRDQNGRLDELETEVDRLSGFIKKHCQGHRDDGSNWSDCTEL